MSEQRSSKQRHRQYAQSIRVAATLIDGPRTFEEILDRSYGYLRVVGLFRITDRQVCDQAMSVREQLEELRQRGCIIRDGERFSLTPLGRMEVNERFSQLGETGALLREFLLPKTASKITLGVHLALSAIKLPVGLFSGSVGLLNDSLDTLLDGLSSLLVYFGIRFNRERAINVTLVGLMLAIGSLTLYEAVWRLFVPFEPEADGYAFVAAIFSAIVSLALYVYQRFVGLRSGTRALVTQSVDSRNHIIVAAGVTAGLFASLLRFPLLDTLVGLGVALIILKSAVELAIDMVRSLGEAEIVLSHFEFGMVVQYDKFRQRQLRDWMLYLVEKQAVGTRMELVARAREALDFNRIPALRAMELSQHQPRVDEIVEHSLAELLKRGWLAGEERLSITDAGKKHLVGGRIPRGFAGKFEESQ
jgi:hypothetical protein